MNRFLRNLLLTALLVVAVTVILTSCGSLDSEDGVNVNTLPAVTTDPIPEGVFYVRCSEPEENTFSVQFVGAVSSCYVDYVGFEANKLYSDGTRGSTDSTKIRTLHKEITDTNQGIRIKPADFGVPDGYLFTKSFRMSIEDQDLRYEVAAYYVLDNEKIYTAKQVFSVQTLLEDHILANPKPFDVKDTSDLIDVQKWVKYTLPAKNSVATDEEGNPTGLSDTYFIGSSAPDQNGYVKMYVCYAVPSANNNSVGIRYNFTETQGDFKDVNTQVRRERTYTLYNTVISEKETLTLEDFGLSEGFLAVVGFEDDLNTVLCKTYRFNLLAYYSQNAREHTVISNEHLLADMVKDCIVTNHSVAVETYTFIPTNFSEWKDFSEANGNAVGNGLFKIRVTHATNNDGQFKFGMQITSAVPTRFSERIAFVYTAYDKDGNPIGSTDREISVSTMYPSIFGNDETDITSKDFGIDRGYVITMLLNNITLAGEDASFKIDVYYRTGDVKNYITSLTISIDDLAEMVEIVL